MVHRPDKLVIGRTYKLISDINNRIQFLVLHGEFCGRLIFNAEKLEENIAKNPEISNWHVYELTDLEEVLL